MTTTATVIFVLASASPLLLWVLRALLFRRLPAGYRLIFDLALLLISIPFAVELIGWALKFPDNVGDHSPGIGVVFMPLMMVWMIAALIWLSRLLEFAVRKTLAKPLK
jgi:hypothetical protein